GSTSSTLFPYTTLFRSQVKALLQREMFGDLIPVAGRRNAVAGDICPEVGEVVIVLDLDAARQGGVALGVAEDLDVVEVRGVLGRSEEHTSELQSRGHLV